MNRIPFLLCILIASAGHVHGQALKPKLDLYGDPLPAGASVRFGTISLRHPGVTAMAFSADGRQLISFGHDGVIRTWDPTNGRLLDEKATPTTNSIGPATMSPDGKWLAFQDLSPPPTRAVYIWDIKQHRVRHKSTIDQWWYSCPARFSPDGSKVITTGQQGQIHCWDVQSGEFKSVGDQKSHVVHLSFTRDGRLFTLGIDNTAHFWDLKNNTELLSVKLKEKRSGVLSIGADVSPDGKIAAIQFPKVNELYFVDLATGKSTVDWKSPPAPVSTPRFSPDGKTIFVWSKGNVLIWDPVAGKVVKTLPGGASILLIYSPDGKFAAATRGDGFNAVVYVWNLTTGKALSANDPARGHEIHYPWATAISNDGRMVVSQGMRALRTWDAATGRPLQRLLTEDKGLNSVAFSPDNRRLFVGTSSTVEQYDAVSLKKTRSFVMPEKHSGHLISNISVSGDGRRLSALIYSPRKLDDFMCASWTLPDGDNFRATPISAHQFTLTYGRFSVDHKVLFCTHGLVLSAETGKEIATLQVDGWHVSAPLAFSQDGSLIAAQLREKTDNEMKPGKRFAFQVWELATLQPVYRVETKPVGDLAFVGNGTQLLTIGVDSFEIWDLLLEKETLSRSTPFRTSGSFSFATTFTISRDGTKLITGHLDTSLLRWDLPTPVREKRALTEAELKQYWSDLGGLDARRAFQAIHKLSADPDKVMPILRERIKPTPLPTKDEIKKLMAQLHDSTFRIRESAAKRLRQLGPEADALLKEALPANAPLELRRRLDEHYAGHASNLDRDRLLSVRAIRLLAMIDSTASRDLLRTLAGGAPGAWVTQEADGALKRLPR